jgi:transposase
VIDQLQIPAVLAELLPPDPRSKVSDAECVTVMLLNILQGRVALYDMESWVATTDVELLLGAGCPAEAFNDTRLAGCLDNIADAGTEEVLSAVVKAYLGRDPGPRSYTVHHDTTSVSVYGAYAGADYRAVPAYGYSKDHRPDLKQLVFGVSLHGAVGVPLVCTMFSGNTSDPVANRFHIEALADLLPEEDDVTLVGDCKLVDAQTVGLLLLQRFHFVSLLPHTFGRRSTLVEEVRAMDHVLPELARAPGRTKADPDKVYRGCSFDRTFTAGVGSAGANRERDVTLRFLVVESSQLEEQEEATLDRRLGKEREAFEKSLAAISKRTYACETDAQVAIDKVVGRLQHHIAHVGVVAEMIKGKRPRRGRPAADDPQPMVTVYRIIEDQPLSELDEAVTSLRFHARHFVLVTDHLDRTAWPDARILAEYRHQHVLEGHTGFRWLKNVATVAPVLLHTPRRIAALGVVLVLALMVRNDIQFELRRRLAETGETVPSRLDQPTQKPTTETAMLAFRDVQVVHVTIDGIARGRHLTPLSEPARIILRMLHIDESVFQSPPQRKFQPQVSDMHIETTSFQPPT